MKLYRPVGQKEYELIKASGFRNFPPRLDRQPIFYPLLNAEYASQIARNWNTKDEASGFVGYVLEFEVEDKFIAQYEVHTVGSDMHQEYWIPVQDLKKLNKNIIKHRLGFDIIPIDKYVGDCLLKEELRDTIFLSKAQLLGTCYHEFQPGKWKNKHRSEDSIYLDDDDLAAFYYIFAKTIKNYDPYYIQEVDSTGINNLIVAFTKFYESLKITKNVITTLRDVGICDKIMSNETRSQLLETNIEKLLSSTLYFTNWLKDVCKNYGHFALLGI